MRFIDLNCEKFYKILYDNINLAPLLSFDKYKEKFNDFFEKTTIKNGILLSTFSDSKIIVYNNLDPGVKTRFQNSPLLKERFDESFYFTFVLYRKKYYFVFFNLSRFKKNVLAYKVRFDENGNDIEYKKRNTVKEIPFRNTKNFVQCNKGLKNSCQIWAFAKILDLTFEESYEILYKEGWRPDNTYFMEKRWESALKKLGKEFILIWSYYHEKNKKKFTLINVIKKLNTLTNAKNRNFAILVRDHVLCIIDNVIYDNKMTPPYTRVEKIYEIK